MKDEGLSGAVAAQIRAARKARGWTQGALAEAVGTAHNGVSRWESGKDGFRLSTLERIGAALGMTVEVRFVAVEGDASAASQDLAP